MDSCPNQGKRPRKKQSMTKERKIEKRLMRTSPRAGRAIQFIPQIWRVCRAADAVDDVRGQGRLADPSAVGSKHAQSLAGGFGDLGILIGAEWLDFLFNHAVAEVG